MNEATWKKRLLSSTLFAGAMLAVGGPMASAQEADEAVIQTAAAGDEAESRQERVTVTGSRLRRVDTPVAVSTIGSDYLEERGFNNVIDAIEELPFSNLGTNLEGANLANNDFTANANLLNLGTNRTLTLINGRRFVSSNQATVFVPGNANGAQVDLTLINPALIERVETVIGSAGASTYGADAVGGVVNIILKDNFEGIDLTASTGFTEYGDGETYRLTGLFGRNFLNDRANVTLGLEYSDVKRVPGDNPNRVSGRSAADLISPFSTGPTLIRGGGYTNPFLSQNGILVTSPNALAANTTPFYRFAAPAGTAPEAAAYAAFLAQFGATPFQYAQTPAGAALDPMLFVGSYGVGGGFLRVPNTDAATAASLPFLAVPLQFDNAGNLVPYNIGDIQPPNLAQAIRAVGGDGLPLNAYTSLRGAQERFSANLTTRFDVTPNITYKGEYMYAQIASSTIDGTNTNNSFGSTTAGNRALPIFIDENPLLSAQALATLNGLEAQGLVIPTVGGRRTLFLNRALDDIDGGIDETGDDEFFRIVQSVAGEFEFANRNLNWDVGFTWGKVRRDTGADTLLDIEFALATDVVQDANGNLVCYQQTLAAPEDINIRNPDLTFINGPRTPTQAQVNACVPLNLFGSGSPSQAAIDYVSSSTAARNESEQFSAAAQFGGDLWQLPGGMAVFSLQAEYRKETNEFTPGPTFGLGLGRATTGRGSEGELEFTEGGIELNVPIFGEDFTLPFVQLLEFDGAYRGVNRKGKSVTADLVSESVTDYIYRYGGRYKPFDDLTIRGSYSTSVRSPSIVELFGAGIEGFSEAMRGAFHPCDSRNIDGGPSGGIRRTNCQNFAAQLGLPADFLDNFTAPGGSAPAAGASNPFLNNEESETLTYGFVYQPSFIPGLTLSADYYDVKLTGAISLTSIASECFDSTDYPNTIVDGINACTAVVFGMPDPNNPGAFIVPGVNPITGAVVRPPAQIGSPAQTQAPFSSTFTYFDTLNLGATNLEAINGSANYAFQLADLFGERASNLGSMNINATAYYIMDLDRFASVPGPANPQEGEHTDPRLVSIVSFTHDVGRFSHTLQWFRDSSTVSNVLTLPSRATENINWKYDAFNMFNYNFGLELTDNVRVRVGITNLFNETLKEEAFVAGTGVRGDALGRRYNVSLNARF